MTSKAMFIVFFAALVTLSLVHFSKSGFVSIGGCYSACNAGAMKCYRGFGAVFGVASIPFCGASQGACMAACMAGTP